MNYDGDIIRPPSEADSIIIQVTVGCSHNRCTFCGAYKGADKAFRIRTDGEIEENIRLAAKYAGNHRKVFLADGDALILSTRRLRNIFKEIQAALPKAHRVSLYANAKAIRSKSVEELKELKDLGLHRIYMGLESGDDTVLQHIHKGETASSMIAAAKRAKEAGIFLSVTVLLGIAGIDQSVSHAEQTAQTLNAMQPNQIAALCYMPLANTPLGQEVINNQFQLPDAQTMLLELEHLINGLACDRVQFMANHASNYLPLSGRLMRDKEKMLTAISRARTGEQPLVPDYYRAL